MFAKVTVSLGPHRKTTPRRKLCFIILLLLSCLLLPGISYAAEQRVGFWNAYLSQVTILECTNVSLHEQKARLRIHDATRKVLRDLQFRIPAKGTRHYPLQGAEFHNSYGTYQLSTLDGKLTPVRCHAVVYRAAPQGSGESLDYAYVVPELVARRGKSSGTYNSMNPDPTAGPVFNWFSLYNPGSKAMYLNIRLVQGAAGLQREKRRVRLAPYQRLDLALGHDHGKQIGMYVIEPDSPTQAYYAFSVRYGIDENRFAFAFPLFADSPACNSGRIPASTMDPATNWAELSNPSSKKVKIKVSIYNSGGKQIAAEFRTLFPYSQQHLHLNRFLGERATGSFRVDCVEKNSPGVLAQSLFYGHERRGSPKVEWAYVTQTPQRSSSESCSAVPVNTFLSSANWLNVINQSGDSSSVQLSLSDSEGSDVSYFNGPLSLPASLRQDSSVLSEVGESFVGTGTVHSSLSVASELLRVYYKENGAIGSISNVPVYKSECSSAATPHTSTPHNPSSPTPTHSTPMPHAEHVPSNEFPIGSSGSSVARVTSTSVQPHAPQPEASFRTVCDFSHYAYDDPIVFPNQPGRSHLHIFFGNTEADAYSTAQSLRQSGSSTCRGGILNRSAYWVPALVDQHGKPIKPSSADIYYKTTAPERVEPLPVGLRMIAGDHSANPLRKQNSHRTYWGCHGKFDGHHASIGDTKCSAGDVLDMNIVFPSCWDGRLDSSDHKSHMAYPTSNGCPSSHPRVLPRISFKIGFQIPHTDTNQHYKSWRIVSDHYNVQRNGGYSLHGDWFNGWDPEINRLWTNQCLRRNLDCRSGLLGDGRRLH